MTSWLCTNPGKNQKPCQHIEVTQGLAPPPPRCPSCGRNTRWDKLPGLTRMGGGPLPSAAELSRKQQMHRKQQVDSIIFGLQEPNMNAGLMGEIRHFIRTVSSNPKLGWVGRIQDLDRISGRLRFAYGLSINAGYLVGKLSPRTTPELIEDLDVALKARWDVGGGLLGGKPDYQRYAESPSGLSDYARRAISLTERQLIEGQVGPLDQ